MPDDGVWLGSLARPDEPPAYTPLYTLATAVAVRDVTRKVGVDTKIKWPNDVIMGGASGGSPARVGDCSTDANAPDDRGYQKLRDTFTGMEGEADCVSWLVTGPRVNVSLDPVGLPEVVTNAAAKAGPVKRHVFIQRVLGRPDILHGDLNAVLPI